MGSSMSAHANNPGGFTQLLAQWIADVRHCHSPEAVGVAERAMADTVACVIAGMGDEAVLRVRRGLSALLHQGSIAESSGYPDLEAPWAALVLGTAAHALDYDDVLDPAASHISAVLIPSLLALSKDNEASGSALVDAYIIGVQAQMLLAEAVNMSHYTKGWHTTSTLGAPAAAAACARLLGLDAERCRHALSIACSLSGGFKRQFGTNTKPFHAGLAAKNGLIAARMAQAGLTADPAPFEGERGFLDLMAGQGSAGFSLAAKKLEALPAAPVPAVWQKRYPCCASTQRAIDAVLELKRVHRIESEDIVRIDTIVSEAAVRNLMYDRPINVMQARFSMPYCLAAAVLDGDLTLSTFTPEALSRADIRSFLPRVSMAADPAQPHDMPATEKSWANVTITTASGSCTMKVINPKGYPEHPLTEAELEAKFQDCASFAGTQPGAGVYSSWRNISAAPDASTLYRSLW